MLFGEDSACASCATWLPLPVVSSIFYNSNIVSPTLGTAGQLAPKVFLGRGGGGGGEMPQRFQWCSLTEFQRRWICFKKTWSNRLRFLEPPGRYIIHYGARATLQSFAIYAHEGHLAQNITTKHTQFYFDVQHRITCAVAIKKTIRILYLPTGVLVCSSCYLIRFLCLRASFGKRARFSLRALDQPTGPGRLLRKGM